MMTKKERWRIPIKKVDKILWCTTFVLFCMLFFVPVAANAAKVHTVSIIKTKVAVREAFDVLKAQTNLYFMYEENRVGEKDVVTLNFKNAPLSEVLKEITKQTGLICEIFDDYILVRNAKNSQTPQRQPSRSVRITGVVTDMAKQPLAGVTIIVKGTQTGVITGDNGAFQLNVPDDATLTFSYVGYTTKDVFVGNKVNIAVQLQEETKSVDEVVVVGYGTKTKETLTGALSSIGTNDILRSPAVNITQSLAGALPGVATVQSSGQPGRDAAKIYVRGNGTLSNGGASPLVMVDGVEREFSDLDPNEIETISVLKDASSTAVFGVRGANGVILVTTRRGSLGAPSISISSSVGLQQPISLMDPANSYDYARMWNMRADNDGTLQRFSKEQIEAFRTHADPIMAPDVNWLDYMFHKQYFQNQNNITISGGSEKIKYFVSVGYTYQNGLMKQFKELPYDNNFRYDRYNYRANIDASLTKTTKMKFSIGGNVGKVREPIAIENVDYVWNVATVWAVPFAGPGIINGKRTLVASSLSPSGDIVRDGLFAFYGYGYKEAYETRLNFDLDINQELDMVLPGLSIGIKGAYDSKFNLQKRRETSTWSNAAEYQKAYYKSQLTDPSLPMTDPAFDKTIVYVPVGTDQPLRYSETNNDNDRKWYVEARLNYERAFGDHKVTALVLYNQSRDYYPTTYRFMPRGYVGMVGRATYSYMNKYIVDINAGYNGSENFAPGKTRFGWFPAVSGAWIASAEKFMENQKVVDYLKFRASWGRVGSDVGNKSRFMYMPSTWSQIDNEGYSFGINNPILSPVFTADTPGNPIVTWETADKQDYGIDVKFLKGRLSANFDYFIEKRTGILITPKSVPAIIATTLPNMNLGKVDNKGYEAIVGWRDNVGNDFSYNVSVNMSYSRNKIVFMDEVPNEYDYMNHTGGTTDRFSNMYRFERFYGYDDFDRDAQGNYVLKSGYPKPFMAVQPGDAMYRDLNGDDIVDEKDRMVYGYSNRPEYVFGIIGGFDYKGWGFNMQWTGATHVQKMFDLDYRVPFTNANRGLLQVFVDESWTPERQSKATMPRLSKTMQTWNHAASTLWLKDASYLRLKTVNLYYTLRNRRFLSAIGIESAKITLSGYNLLTFSKFKLVDPEAITDNGGQYPLTKVYNIGIRVNF